MTPLSDALVAAQRRALAALEKAYVAEALDAETVVDRAKAFGVADPVDLAALLAALDVLREWGAPVPAETNGRATEEKMSDKQRGFIEQLCREKNLPRDAAWAAAWAAARDALEPTVKQLQASALLLVDRMIEAK